MSTDCQPMVGYALFASRRGKMETRDLDQLAALERMEMYWTAHPRSPSAVRRPRLLKRGRTWIAVLGANSQDGIAGFGPTVETALHSFDAQYLRYLRAPIAA